MEYTNNTIKTDEELAMEGSDPYAMLRYSSVILNNKENPDFNKAFELVQRAVHLYPNNLDVKNSYCILLAMRGHAAKQIGIFDSAMENFEKALDIVDFLRSQNYDMKKVASIESDICMEYGELAFVNDELELALELFQRTDSMRYPYAVVLKTLIHTSHPIKYRDDIIYDAEDLVRVVSMDTWSNMIDKATAYELLSVIYATGMENTIKKDVKFAYECIQKCAEIDPELAAPKLAKYSKNLFGKIRYIN